LPARKEESDQTPAPHAHMRASADSAVAVTRICPTVQSPRAVRVLTRGEANVPQVNGALLAHTQRPAQAPLERLLKHMVVTRDALAAETGTPRFNLRDHVQRHCTP
jgi:hypothetical protein